MSFKDLVEETYGGMKATTGPSHAASSAAKVEVAPTSAKMSIKSTSPKPDVKTDASLVKENSLKVSALKHAQETLQKTAEVINSLVEENTQLHEKLVRRDKYDQAVRVCQKLASKGRLAPELIMSRAEDLLRNNEDLDVFEKAADLNFETRRPLFDLEVQDRVEKTDSYNNNVAEFLMFGRETS